VGTAQPKVRISQLFLRKQKRRNGTKHKKQTETEQREFRIRASAVV